MTVVDLLEYHDLAPSRHTPAIPLVRVRPAPPAPRVRPAPIVRMTPGTIVTVRSCPDTMGLARNAVTYWRAATWT